MPKRKILITGGAGFIGFHLARKLSQEKGTKLILVDNFSRGKSDREFQELLRLRNVSVLSGDLTDPRTFKKLGRGYDEVYHLAALLGVQRVVRSPHEVLRINAISTLHLLDWFVKGGGKKLLFSSTSEAYAWTQHFHKLPIPTPEDVPLALTDLYEPRSTYAASKVYGEISVIQYCRQFNKPFVITRYHNVYGPRMGYEHVVPQLIERALQRPRTFPVFSASHRRAFCYVSDAVETTFRAMRQSRGNGLIFNVGNDDEEITIGSLARKVLQKLAVKSKLAPKTNHHDPIARRCPDIRRARKILKYKPEVTLDEGLDRTIAWYLVHPRPA